MDKEKRDNLISLVLTLIVLAVLLNMFIGRRGGGGEVAMVEDNNTAVETAVRVEEPKEEIKSKEEIAEMYASMMRDNFRTTAEIELVWNDGIPVFVMHPIGDEVVTMMMYIDLGDRGMIEEWIGIRNSMAEMSNTMSVSLDNHAIVFMNPLNRDKAILMVMNGEIILDYLYD